MDIEATGNGTARTWQHAEPGLGMMAFWTERVPHHGEDADPLAILHRPTGRGLIAVFDGVGGAGGASAGPMPSGRERTQAWVAARRVRGLVEEWFIDQAPAGELRGRIAARLGEGTIAQSRVRGTISRRLPSTLAAIAFRVSAGQVWWDVLWAGDSRCFLLRAGQGLQQLSRDDAAGSDALELLVQDPPMTNMVCADRAFTLNHRRGAISAPCILLVATDGVFGYVQTPAQVEHVLLDTLMEAVDLAHWVRLLSARVVSYTADDASLAVVALGYESVQALRGQFRGRADFLARQHESPVAEAARTDHRALVTAREESWRRYRPTYEGELPRVTTIAEEPR